MKYIDLDEIRKRVNAKSNWSQKADSALNKARTVTESDRATEINKRQDIWRSLKVDLRKVSDEKCWYCESKDLGSDNAVDHYRPKNRVVNDTGDYLPGYWWLAFDWRNYRFSCTYCNSKRTAAETRGGKHDSFPIWNENNRGKPEAPPNQLGAEQPLLLDPTRLGDIGLITFECDGSVVPTHSKKENPYLNEKARVSIDLYHLQLKQKKDTRRAIWAEVEGYLENAAPHYGGWKTGDNPSAESAFDSAIASVKKLIKPSAEFHAAAKAALRSARGKRSPIGEIANYILDL